MIHQSSIKYGRYKRLYRRKNNSVVRGLCSFRFTSTAKFTFYRNTLNYKNTLGLSKCSQSTGGLQLFLSVSKYVPTNSSR